MSKSPLPPWVDQAKRVLDESARDLDAATLSRLNRARQAALQQGARARRAWLMPTAGLAGACVLLLAVALWQRPHLPGAGSNPAQARNPVSLSGGDADIVSGDDSLEFYQDLEFYAWLDAQDQDSDS